MTIGAFIAQGLDTLARAIEGDKFLVGAGSKQMVLSVYDDG